MIAEDRKKIVICHPLPLTTNQHKFEGNYCIANFIKMDRLYNYLPFLVLLFSLKESRSLVWIISLYSADTKASHLRLNDCDKEVAKVMEVLPSCLGLGLLAGYSHHCL